MADDYISRKAAINAICQDWCNRDYCGDCFFHGAKQAIDVLKALPSENVQPVVQCKYCKHSTEWYGDRRRCFLWCEDGIGVFEDGYCNYWDRKDGDTDG